MVGRWLSNNYGKLSVVTPRDEGSFSRGKDAKYGRRRGRTRRRWRRLRRDGMEMVGDSK